METGIKALDKKIGNIPDKNTVLLAAAPGIDPAPYGLSMLLNAIDEGLTGLYIVNNKPPLAVRREASTLGFDVVQHEQQDKLSIIDAFSGYTNIPSDERWIIDEPLKASNIVTYLDDILKDKSVIMIDSLSSFLDMKEGSLTEILDMVQRLKQKAIVIALFSLWEYEASLIAQIKETFDGVFVIKHIEEVTIIREFLIPEKIGWNPNEVADFAVPVKILKPGGIRIYFPKILVTGPFNAGKSTMVHAMSATAVSVDRMGTTIALDHGYLDYKGFTADIYGTPGQEYFDPILKYLADEAVGVVLVVDSTDPKTFVRAKEMLSKTRAEGLPVILAANKQDAADALSVDEIKERIRLKNVPIVPTSGINRDGVEELLDRLLAQLMGD